MNTLPQRLKALRRRHGLSLEQLACRTDLTKSYLSKLERGLSEPSISTVLKISEAYGIGVAQLVGDAATIQEESVSVVRVAERVPLQQNGDARDQRYQSIAGKRLVRKMEPFVVHPPRVFMEADVESRHSGEELMVVLRGAIEVEVGHVTARLERGDSIYFDSEIPHRMRTIGRGVAEVLVVATH